MYSNAGYENLIRFTRVARPTVCRFAVSVWRVCCQVVRVCRVLLYTVCQRYPKINGKTATTNAAHTENTGR